MQIQAYASEEFVLFYFFLGSKAIDTCLFLITKTGSSTHETSKVEAVLLCCEAVGF